MIVGKWLGRNEEGRKEEDLGRNGEWRDIKNV